ncbi:hypothetical protein ATANTOWER_002467 [Ataeniobius toweri]|uniref:Uncharacterized protein n=1 Tax=Ataeniobius toweri TaxID=208326 RepID=A0ABU7B4B9_9TELE|nr:hypothetical protein [Ataeniobius toweri]
MQIDIFSQTYKCQSQGLRSSWPIKKSTEMANGKIYLCGTFWLTCKTLCVGVLDHLFAECCALLCLPASAAIMYPRIVCYYNSQQVLQLIGRGRRSSDVTVDYIII